MSSAAVTLEEEYPLGRSIHVVGSEQCAGSLLRLLLAGWQQPAAPLEQVQLELVG